MVTLIFVFPRHKYLGDEAIYVQFSHTEIKMRWQCERVKVAFNW